MENKVKHLLSAYTGHAAIELTSRGNTAIFAALYVARKLRLKKKTVLIPDQGGWLSYRKYPKMLEMKIIELKTDLGVIDPGELKKALDTHDVNCVLYQNPAGYFAEQDMKGIYDACRGRCAVILDVSGSLGYPKMCDGNYADVMVGSFGHAKPVDVGYGGFVSIKEDRNHELAGEIFNTTAFDDEYLEPLYNELKGVGQKMDRLFRESGKIKDELKGFEIAHRDRKGINVIVMYDTEKVKQEIIAYCEKNKYQYTQCPRYIRVMRDAISIEVKRMR
jgi:dTDP-4-amino-4,6-dideoxygalactose transaminase